MKTRPIALAAASAIGLACASASASVIDFESLGNGAIVTNQFAAPPDYVTISANNFNRPFNIAAIFDTTIASGDDPDLNGPPWAGGNIINEQLGSILIISERDEDPGNPGFVLGPDDEGERPAGTITLDYSLGFTTFQIDIVDIESTVAENSSFEFYQGGLAGFKVVVDFMAFEDNTSAFYDPTIQFGNRTANRIRPITAADLGLQFIDTVVINAGGSSGWDNINASGFIPAPGAAALLGLGALAIGRRRRN